MIASLNGRILDIEPHGLTVDLGGVGLLVHVPARLRDEAQRGHTIFLHTRLIVRETELSLYGFATREERDFFDLLLGVNGIGPRLALSVLSTLNPAAIRRAVFNEQDEVLNRVPGVGKKTAQKIVLHLQDKIANVDGLEPMAALDDVDTQVLEALTGMGFSVVEAQAALQIIPRDTPQDVEERLRVALGYFNRP
ncbi:MAG: Holliday junction branch migration protein RuvA [Anaerolineae bacterium]|nr:MAG: Holliday junction branch migration protein RuvA [Anaerolineae bacterium]